MALYGSKPLSLISISNIYALSVYKNPLWHKMQELLVLLDRDAVNTITLLLTTKLYSVDENSHLLVKQVTKLVNILS